MVRKLLIILPFVYYYAIHAEAQFVYKWDQSIPVTTYNDPLDLAWAGGINSAQLSTMDLDNDGVEDLVIFDRTTEKISTFLVTDSAYKYAPGYESRFPDNLKGWMLLRDFNCDGLKDLFTHTPFGIKVYENTSSSNSSISWNLILDPIFTAGSSGQINLQVSVLDLPGIEDLDGDGDLDILVYNFATGGGIEYHQNLSMENSGSCGLEFARITKTWGDFEECECDLFAFGSEICEDLESSARTKHIGGKSLLPLDIDNDGDKEILIGQEDCKTLYYLENIGTKDSALMREFSLDFPNPDFPIRSFYFPAAYYEDVNGDGLKDLVSSPNFAFNYENSLDFTNSLWFYKNIGSNAYPELEFESRSFLQSEMLDIGESVTASFADNDRDGDLDLFLSYKGNATSDKLIGSIWFFRNTGNASQPSFTLVDEDYFGLHGLELSYMTHQFVDINGDGDDDLVFKGSVDGIKSKIYILFNKSSSVFSFNISEVLEIPFEFPAEDQFHIADINGDQLPDLLHASSSGQLDYYKNTGTSDSPVFILNTEAYYGISADFNRKKLSVTVSDLNFDGNNDLITVDERGKIVWYSNFLNISNTANPGEELVFEGQGSTIIASHNFGTNASLSTARIFTDAEPSIIVGLKTGGLQILRKSNAQIGPPSSETELQIIIYPNPTMGINNGLISVISNRSGQVQVLSYMGQKISDIYEIQAGNILQIETRTLRNGLYLLKMESVWGSKKTMQFLVLN